MRICIAINGEGRGHLSRARALAEELREKHEITFRAPEHFKKELTSLFPECPVKTIPYFGFEQKGFSIDYFMTGVKNAKLFLSARWVRNAVARELKAERTEAVLSDFEPFTSRAAKLLGIPVLQLNHPGIVTRAGAPTAESVSASIIAKYMMAYADKTILCSFFDGDVGPIVRRELREKTITRGNRFVVYQKPLYKDILEPVLDEIGRDHFSLFPNPQEDYASALASSAGLIAPAGHQSISEALALGKPVFVIPVQGQYEQELNAHKLKKSGFGDWCFAQDISRELPRFISNISAYERAISLAKERGFGGTVFGERWLCADDTLRAVDLVERFIAESKMRPEWNRSKIFEPLLASLYA
jgi:UDP:flavonoid glycosyltransferase YjiC (YdhE family)